ncbi:MAG: PAS domain-containing protein, partial [Desulfobacterales bacterium]|nr:PAS domain-containing protein [Desulfobacterales bacterium]
EPGEIVNFKRYISAVLPEDRDFVVKEVKDALDGKKPYENEHRIVRKGEIRIHHTQGKVYRDEQGNPLSMLGIVEDITKRKQAEEEIRRSKILLEASIESPKDMIILSLDRDYRYIFFNKTHAESMGHVFGTQPRIGDCIFDFMKGEADIKKVKAHYDRTLAGEGHVAIEKYGADQLRYYYEIRYNPVYDEKNEIIGVTSFAQNITERKQAEEELAKHREHLEDLVRERTMELRASEERLELAIEGAELGMWDWNIQTGDTRFSQIWLEILGYTSGEIEPRVEAWERLVHPDDMLRVMETLQKNLDGQTPFYECEHRLRPRSGQWKWIL